MSSNANTKYLFLIFTVLRVLPVAWVLPVDDATMAITERGSRKLKKFE